MVYGYARISRPQQSIDRQVRNIKAECAKAVIVQEAYIDTAVYAENDKDRIELQGTDEDE